jgi:cytochrome c-type biogenesis protein CcmF
VNLLTSLPTTTNSLIQFKNEWLWLGNLGEMLMVLMFMSALISAVFYFKNNQHPSETLYLKIARISLNIHALSVISVFSILFALIFFHRYEYYYAWRHSSNSLPVYYMISCFWEGQEGSFLLWIFWNAMIALVLKRKAGKWESPVLAIIAFAQVVLSSMILGFEIGDFKLGSSPFQLLREERPDFLNIPILGALGVDNYLQVFKDGNGLNKLLQNYWMVIHPPTLFLGFALAIVPFAYSLSALWNKEDRSWLMPALIWGLACVGILGTGIIMGGFWAYESLSFGGYWAWDPVENASLLPWLIMTSAVHLIIISKNTGRHLFTSHLLTQLSFWLVLYATFLTRSGILGESSVHSFTDLGLSGQLLIFLLVFIGISALASLNGKKLRMKFAWGLLVIFLVPIILAYTLPESAQSQFSSSVKWLGIIAFFVVLIVFIWNLFKNNKNEIADEHLSSREFWIFLGSMFIILSLIQIFTGTSIPVFNKLFGYKMAVPTEDDYNRIQLWMAMPIMVLMAVAQFFHFRETPNKVWIKNISISLITAIVVTVLVNLVFAIEGLGNLLFLLFAVWLVVGNFQIIWQRKKWRFMNWGAPLSHLGFGVLLVGVLVSSVNQKILSSTSNGIALAPEQDEKGKLDIKGIQFNRENLLIYKNEPLEMGDYKVTYLGNKKGIIYDTLDEFFYLHFRNIRTGDTFILAPKTQNNPKMGLLAEPSTKHFIHKDIFTHVNYHSGMDKKEPYSSFVSDTVVLGQKFTTSTGKCQLTPLQLMKSTDDKGLALKLEVQVERLGKKSLMYPMILINEQNGNLESLPVEDETTGVILTLQNFKIDDPDPAKQKISFVIQTGEKTPVKDYVVLKAVLFPWINLVWFGTIIMVIGFVIAVTHRIQVQNNLK